MQRTNRKVRFYDDEVDKYWLCGCSPYILFKGSRSDLGTFRNVHLDVYSATRQD